MPLAESHGKVIQLLIQVVQQADSLSTQVIDTKSAELQFLTTKHFCVSTYMRTTLCHPDRCNLTWMIMVSTLSGENFSLKRDLASELRIGASSIN